MTLLNALTDIPGIRVGHAQDEAALTGCTVVLCEQGAIGGVDQRGGASGSREIDALNHMHLVQQVHAIVLSGGSAFGLDSASGVVRYLEERGVGFDVRVARVPIVPAAILFDLSIGDANVRPDAQMGYQACLNATDGKPTEGNVGAGCGATVGKILGVDRAMKSGIGSASLEIGEGVMVAAIVAVNAFGDVIDPTNGRIIAGARSTQKESDQFTETNNFADTMQVMKTFIGKKSLLFGKHENTVIGIIATNAALNKAQVNKVAQMAHDGLARTIRPSHTMLDGDTIFALSSGDKLADVNIIGAYAADVFSIAIIRAIQKAKSVGGIPAVSSF